MTFVSRISASSSILTDIDFFSGILQNPYDVNENSRRDFTTNSEKVTLLKWLK